MGEPVFLPYLGSWLYRVLYRPHLDLTSPALLEKIRAAYGAEDFAMLTRSLEWAVSNPTYPFSSMFQDDALSDKEIYDTFCRILAAIKAE
jgi:hypothetical protein